MQRVQLALATALAFLAAIQDVRGDMLIDGFSNGLNNSRWRLETIDAVGAPWGVTAPDSNGGIRMSKSADSDGSTSNIHISSLVRSQFWFGGDFSTSIGFDIITMPASSSGWNEAVLIVKAMDGTWDFLSLRFTQGSTHYAEGFSSFPPYSLGFHEDNTMQGRLGISREGGELSAWIDRGQGAVSLGSVSAPNVLGPVSVLFGVSQVVPCADVCLRPQTELDVRFDDFFLQAGTIVPEPVTIFPLAITFLIFVRSKRA